MPQKELKRAAADVFISYSSDDQSVVDALCRFLEGKKIRCWMAKRDILPGQDYAGAIVQAMNGAGIVVFVCSSSSLISEAVRNEIAMAKKRGKKVIPFRIENCSIEDTPIEYHLATSQWIDAFPQPARAFGTLAEAVFSQPGITPPAPRKGRGTGKKNPPGDKPSSGGPDDKPSQPPAPRKEPSPGIDRATWAAVGALATGHPEVALGVLAWKLIKKRPKKSDGGDAGKTEESRS